MDDIITFGVCMLNSTTSFSFTYFSPYVAFRVSASSDLKGTPLPLVRDVFFGHHIQNLNG